MVDDVVAVSVDDRNNPKFAKVHIIDGDDIRERFNRAHAARMQAKHSIPVGRGVWVSLYLPEANDPVTHVGAGAGLKYPAIATVPLVQGPANVEQIVSTKPPQLEEAPLTIAEAKRRLAITLGVDPANIKISVEAWTAGLRDEERPGR